MHARGLLGHAWLCLIAVLLLGLAAAVPGKAQVSLERVIGEVTATNPGARQIALKMDAGGTVTVILQDKTLYLRVPPGETDLKKGVKITPAEIGVGDRVYARGRLAEDQKSIPAVAIIVMTKADLAQKRERERAEWQKRGLAGTISALNPASQEITLSVRSGEGTRTLTIEPSQKAVFRRYAPDSVRFGQAGPSSFAELKIGDSVRLLGEKNSDGTRITLEEIVSGSFRNIPGIIRAIDAAGGEIRITDLQSKRLLTVQITSDALLRRLPPVKAAAAGTRPQEGGKGATPGGQPGAGPTQAAPPATAITRPQEGGKGATPGGQPGAGSTQAAPPGTATTRPQEGGKGATPGGQPGAGPTQAAPPVPRPEREGRTSEPAPRTTKNDSTGGAGQMDLARMPVLKFGELKKDEAILVLCTVGAEPSRVTAIVVVAGVEPLLGPAQQDQTQIGGAWNFFDISVP